MIADHLLREIREGLYPVGSLLPTEAEMMRAFGVSRHTVRFAVQDLKNRGIIVSRQGQGSKVVTTEPENAFVEKIQTIDELITFGQETVRELISSRVIEANVAVAETFECAIGRRLAEARMLRKTTSPNPKTIALVTLWMDALLEPVIKDLASIHKSAAEIIDDNYGYATKSVTQTVQAGMFSDEESALLEIPFGLPSLIIVRRYCTSKTATPFLVARSACRADAIKLASTFVSFA